MSDFGSFCQQVVDASKELTRKGFLSATGGNVSLRIPEKQAFAITPSNFDYTKMSKDDICVLDLDSRPLAGERTPSVESAMHAAIYKTRPDVNAIIHTHQVYPSTLALIGKSIPALFDEQARFLGRSVDIIPYAPSGTGMLVKTVVKKIGNHNNAYMMANHGALLFAGDMERAMHNVAVLEKCALAYLLTLCTEQKASRIPLLVREVAFSKLRKDQKKYE